MTNSEARKRQQEAARTTHAPLSQPHSTEAHSDPTGALGGSEGVEAIRARVEAATPGPWHEEPDPEFRGENWCCVTQGDFGWVAPGSGPLYDVDSEQGKHDAEFIAHARTDVPLLLAALDESRAEVEHWKQRLHARNAELNAANERCDRLESLANKHFARAEKAQAEQAYTYGIARKADARATAAEAVVASVQELADALDAWDGDPTSPFASSPNQRDQLRAALTPSPSPAPAAPTAAEPTVVTSGDEASVGEATRCRCGSDATSLNPAEVVVHQIGAPCYIAALTPTTTETGDDHA